MSAASNAFITFLLSTTFQNQFLLNFRNAPWHQEDSTYAYWTAGRQHAKTMMMQVAAATTTSTIHKEDDPAISKSTKSGQARVIQASHSTRHQSFKSDR